MPRKPHLQFRGEQIFSDSFTYLPRVPGASEPEERKNYSRMQDSFRSSLSSFTRKRDDRQAGRTPGIDVQHMDFIQLEFFDVFDVANFEKQYRETFGLTPVAFSNYNRTGLFAIEDSVLFKTFIQDVETFINAKNPFDSGRAYSDKIRFIKSFDGFTTAEILGIDQSQKKVSVNLFKTVQLYSSFIEPVRQKLIEYLDAEGVVYQADEQAERLELDAPEWRIIQDIARNFDIIQRISSHDSGIIRPSAIGTPIREFGFTVGSEQIDELPVIGILDSGVGDQTPLSPLLIKADPPYDLTNTDPFDDNIDHGTGVAGLAALGRAPYPDFTGEVAPDARILPVKILHENNSVISQKAVIEAIRRAKNEYGVRIFVLSITWTDIKKNHEFPSDYTLALDKLSNELDILIFISTGNRNQLIKSATELIKYPDHFLEEESNLQTPADSMNNVTVGAVADNLRENAGDSDRFSIDGSLPAVYSRKFHYDWTDDIKTSIANHKLVKPDILMPGGDYDEQTNPDVYGMKVLSSKPGTFFNSMPGTSYAAPLAANLAARLIKAYPEIRRIQTIKALLINASRKIPMGDIFEDFGNPSKIAVCGYGRPDENACLYSDDHRATFVIEGSIRPERMDIFELKLPAYLLEAKKSQSLLKVHATLCFSFNPVPDNQLAYCPVHFAFGFFKNLTLEQIKRGKAKDIKLKQGWSEDYYYKKGLLSNTQKVDFSIGKKDIVNTENIVRIGIHSRLHRHLDAAQRAGREQHHSFSLAISIEETTKESNRTHRLYDELVAINELKAIAELDIDLDV